MMIGEKYHIGFYIPYIVGIDALLCGLCSKGLFYGDSAVVTIRKNQG
jgi:hypothetical protein